nr:SMC-Scp complex subunit ScpB [Kribbella sandramycini]
MRRALEAILMVTDEPLPVLTLARAVGRPTGDVTGALEELSAEYGEQGRGFDLREIGGGWRYYTRPEAAVYVERFVLDGQQARLTQAALETLSVVAYKQPVSRARVSAIRGVNVDGVMRTLIARGLVEEAGADTESQATLYRTTTYFLERMGMQSLDDLPELAPYLPDMDDIEDELAAQSAAPEPPAEPEEAPGPLENDLAPEPQSPPAAEADDEDDEDDDTPQPGEPVVDEAEHSQSGTAEAETSDDEDDDESEYGATAGTPQSGVSVDDGESAVAVNEELDADAEESVHDGTGATAADDWQAEVADEAAEGLADGDGSVADGSPSAVANEELDADGDHVDAADGEAGDASAGEPVRSRWYPYDRTAEEIAAEGERRE